MARENRWPDALPQDEAKRLQALFVRRLQGVDLPLVQADPGLLFDLGEPRLPVLPFRWRTKAVLGLIRR